MGHDKYKDKSSKRQMYMLEVKLIEPQAIHETKLIWVAIKKQIKGKMK